MEFSIEKLKNIDIFEKTREELLTKVVSNGQLKRIAKNSDIFLQGFVGTSFYILVEGSIRLYKTTEDGREITVKIVKQNEIFGEVVMFEDQHYPVTAVAMKRSFVFEIPKSIFLNLFDDRGFTFDFIKILMKKQRYLAERIVYLTSLDVEERFFSFIKERYGKKNEYIIDLKKNEIASAIGTIPETFSRLVLRLKKRGLIDWQHERLTVKDHFWDDIF